MHKFIFVFSLFFCFSCGSCKSNKPAAVVQQPKTSTAPPSIPQGNTKRDPATPGFRLPDNFANQKDPAVLQRSTAKPAASTTPKEAAMADVRFPQSKYLHPLRELDINAAKPPHTSPKARILKPGAYASWEAAGINDPAIEQFLLTPGDYTGWGALRPTRSGKDKAPVILRYYDPGAAMPYHPEHPVKLKARGKEAIIEGIRFDNINYWTIHGISFRGKSADKRGVVGGAMNRLSEANYIVIDYCLIEDVSRGAIRMANTSYCHIQNNVFRQNNLDLNGDGGAVGITASRDREARNNRIVNNEIINFNDGVGLPREGARNRETKDPEMDMVGDCPGTVFENNDIYITDALYVKNAEGVFSCAENAMDLKNGTKSLVPEDRVKIISNRMWGFRPSDPNCGPSGSAGPAITLHRNASNIIMRDNIIFDVPIVLTVVGHDRKFPDESMENIAFINNLCFDIKKTTPYPYGGSAFVLATGIDAYYNTIVNSRQAVYISNDKAINRFQCNTFVNIETAEAFPDQAKRSWSDLNAWYQAPEKNRLYSPNGQRITTGKTVKEADLDEFVFYIKRWTGPERRTVPNAIPSTTKKGPKVPVASDCHCAKGGEGGRWWAKE